MQFHEPEEFEAAMAALTPVERMRLRKALRAFACSPLADGSDLLQETFLRVRLRSRRWPAGVPVLAFAIQVMRSLADEADKKLKREKLTVAPGSRRAGVPDLAEVSASNSKGVGDLSAPPVTPEDHLIAADLRNLFSQWRQQVQNVFADDEDAQLLIEGIFDGLKGRELQDLTGLDNTAFASKRKLIQRRLTKLAENEDARRKQA